MIVFKEKSEPRGKCSYVPVFQKTVMENEHCGPEVSGTGATRKVGRDFSCVLIRKARVQKQVRVDRALSADRSASTLSGSGGAAIETD